MEIVVKKVLVVGGAGYIGSYVNKLLNISGYETIVLDNLSKGDKRSVTRGAFIEGDLGDIALLQNIFTENQIDAVMHFAAFTNVGESVSDPAKYYQNNVCNTLSLLKAMLAHNIKIFIFSSTAAIFGLPQEELITENHPTKPINPYGKSKLMVEEILEDFSYAYDFKYCALRYFNAAGGDPDKEVKIYNRHYSNLIPACLQAIINPDHTISIFGTDYPTFDGTGIRDYIHLHDLGTSHLLAMKSLLEGAPSCQYNLGNGRGFSVREVIETIQTVTNTNLKVLEGDRRAGDPALLLADSSKAEQELNWRPKYPDLETIITDHWQAIEK